MSHDITTDEVEQIEQALRMADFEDDQYNLSHKNGTVTIQFHDLYTDQFGEFLETLAREHYSYDVDSGFEVPPLLKIDRRADVPEGYDG